MIEKLHHIFAELSIDVSQQCWVAYSGGLDSHVLLHALSALRKSYPQLRLKAIHVHHGISPHANTWVKHCMATCKGLQIECVLKTVNVPAVLDRHSPEAVARDLRYRAFKEVMGGGRLSVFSSS